MQMQQIQTPSGPKLIAVPVNVGQAAAAGLQAGQPITTAVVQQPSTAVVQQPSASPGGSHVRYLGMTCDVRSQFASCDVRVRTHFVETCDVRACGAFLGLRCAITIWHIFQQ